MEKKLVTISVPIFNEVEMVFEIYERVNSVFTNIPNYNYELVFFDDGSTDGTEREIEKMCKIHKEVKYVGYAKNFGYLKNTFYCVQQSKGDCSMLLHSDLQNPPELIPEFLKKWEGGAMVVQGVKRKSKEGKMKWFLKSIYYFVLIKIFGVKIKAHATEFELFDKSFIEILKQKKPRKPFLRGIVSEYALSTEQVYYEQEARKKGKSKFKFKSMFSFTVTAIGQYSKHLSFILVLSGILLLSVFSLGFVLFFIHHLPSISTIGLAGSLILCAFCVLFSLFIIGLGFCWRCIREYNKNRKCDPVVVEKKRINY